MPGTFMKRYVYRPYGQSTDRFDVVWVLPEGFSPSLSDSQPAQVSARRNPESPPLAPFLTDLHFPQYIESLNASHKKLKSLVRLPNKVYARSLSGSRQYLELGLLAIHESMGSYLKDANTFVSQWHEHIRNAFVSG
jgi:hypothetical protein